MNLLPDSGAMTFSALPCRKGHRSEPGGDVVAISCQKDKNLVTCPRSHSMWVAVEPELDTRSSEMGPSSFPIQFEPARMGGNSFLKKNYLWEAEHVTELVSEYPKSGHQRIWPRTPAPSIRNQYSTVASPTLGSPPSWGFYGGISFWKPILPQSPLPFP